MAVVQLLLFAVLSSVVAAGKNDIYSGYSLHGVQIRDFSDLKYLHELETSLNLDQWDHGAPGGLKDASFMVSPQNTDAFLKNLDERGIVHYLMIEDMARAVDEFDRSHSLYRAKRSGSDRAAIPFDDYPRYVEIDNYLERIAAQYPDIVTLVNIGQSFEGRDIKYLKISTTNFTDASKPIYYMDAMIHAREWVTTPVALYSIHRLVEDLRDEDRDLLEGIDWIIHPMVNPDGYEYTHTDERLWRGTRSINPDLNTTCRGVDGNRNFDVDFNTVGVDSNPCSLVYPGVTAFSEPETRYIRDILHEYLDRIQVYLNIHSQGNWVLYGYGNGTVPANGMELHVVGAVMGAAIDTAKLPRALFYTVGNTANMLYEVSGCASDYGQKEGRSVTTALPLTLLYAVLQSSRDHGTCNSVEISGNSKHKYIGVPLSYTLELPGLGYGHMVPPDYIAQINGETWLGIAAQARVAKLYYNKRIQNAQA